MQSQQLQQQQLQQQQQQQLLPGGEVRYTLPAAPAGQLSQPAQPAFMTAEYLQSLANQAALMNPVWSPVPQAVACPPAIAPQATALSPAYAQPPTADVSAQVASLQQQLMAITAPHQHLQLQQQQQRPQPQFQHQLQPLQHLQQPQQSAAPLLQQHPQVNMPAMHMPPTQSLLAAPPPTHAPAPVPDTHAKRVQQDTSMHLFSHITTEEAKEIAEKDPTHYEFIDAKDCPTYRQKEDLLQLHHSCDQILKDHKEHTEKKPKLMQECSFGDDCYCYNCCHGLCPTYLAFGICLEQLKFIRNRQRSRPGVKQADGTESTIPARCRCEAGEHAIVFLTPGEKMTGATKILRAKTTATIGRAPAWRPTAVADYDEYVKVKINNRNAGRDNHNKRRDQADRHSFANQAYANGKQSAVHGLHNNQSMTTTMLNSEATRLAMTGASPAQYQAASAELVHAQNNMLANAQQAYPAPPAGGILSSADANLINNRADRGKRPRDDAAVPAPNTGAGSANT